MVGFARRNAGPYPFGYRAVAGSPLSSKEDWYLIAAWVLAGAYLWLTCFHPRNAYGVFLLPWSWG